MDESVKGRDPFGEKPRGVVIQNSITFKINRKNELFFTYDNKDVKEPIGLTIPCKIDEYSKRMDELGIKYSRGYFEQKSKEWYEKRTLRVIETLNDGSSNEIASFAGGIIAGAQTDRDNPSIVDGIIIGLSNVYLDRDE